MGCIYHLGIDTGTLIEGNVCTNTSAYYYGGWGYYLASNNGLFEPFAYKTSILPRQARDKHRENSRKGPLFLRRYRAEELEQSKTKGPPDVSEHGSFEPFVYKCDLLTLQRQARDKHRERALKKRHYRFLRRAKSLMSSLAAGDGAEDDGAKTVSKTVFWPSQFSDAIQSFAKTGSGQTAGKSNVN
jgi:hypothetical protein